MRVGKRIQEDKIRIVKGKTTSNMPLLKNDQRTNQSEGSNLEVLEP